MRFRILTHLVAGTALTLSFAGSASAQMTEKPLLGAGISFLHETDATGKGFAVDLAQNIRSMDKVAVGIVGDFGLSHFSDIGTVTTFQGGVRATFTTSNPKVKPFAQGIAGLAHFSASNCTGSFCSENDFVFSPGGGVDVMLNDQYNFRAELDFPIVRSNGVTSNDTRFWFGISLLLGK